jgi:hypothetical protein
MKYPCRAFVSFNTIKAAVLAKEQLGKEKILGVKYDVQKINEPTDLIWANQSKK